jgi:hypothetical protein
VQQRHCIIGNARCMLGKSRKLVQTAVNQSVWKALVTLGSIWKFDSSQMKTDIFQTFPTTSSSFQHFPAWKILEFCPPENNFGWQCFQCFPKFSKCFQPFEKPILLVGYHNVQIVSILSLLLPENSHPALLLA